MRVPRLRGNVMRALATLILIGAAPPAAHATTVPYRTDAELVAISDRVVHARVVSVAVDATSTGITTVTRLAILEDLTGIGTGTIDVREPGGVAGGRVFHVPGAPRFVPGQDVVLCLQRAGEAWRTVALSFSAFAVHTQGGATRLTRVRGDLAVVDAPAMAPRSRTLDELRATVARVKGVQALLADPASIAAVTAGASRVDDTFTLLDSNGRWREADTRVPIAWYRNAATPSPLAGANTDTELGIAAAAWTGVDEATIALVYGGARSDGGAAAAGSYCSPATQGTGFISFGNAGGLVPRGALAVGGGCVDAATAHTVNGQRFFAFTHAFVVVSDLSGTYTAVPDFTRILTHEMGHGLGLGHPCTDSCTGELRANVMYPGCCTVQTPVPPVLGPDDRSGLSFIYPDPAVPACTILLSPARTIAEVVGGIASVSVRASAPTCPWRAVSTVPWLVVLGSGSGTGAGTLRYLVLPHLFAQAPRNGVVAIGQSTHEVEQPRDTDKDGDAVSDALERHVGLDPGSATGIEGYNGDPDGDLVTNGLDRHPRGFERRHFAEGVVNAFFDTRVAILNAGDRPAHLAVSATTETGFFNQGLAYLTVGPRSRETLDASAIAAVLGMQREGPFSMSLESDVPIVVDRTVTWDASRYGGHAVAASAAPSSQWYFAEGSTSGEFSLFFQLYVPTPRPYPESAAASIRFLRPAPLPPIDVPLTVSSRNRVTLPVDTLHPDLANTDVAAIVTADRPILAERAMYLNRPGQPFAAGHASTGVTAPATEWFLAEGATGSYFELFLLVANPGSSPAEIEVDYLPTAGPSLTKRYTVAPTSRLTIWVDDEEFPAGSGNKALANASVSLRVRSTNGVPVVVERTMWWPQPAWHEAHNEHGVTEAGTRWGLAEGESGGPAATQTYLLIANPSATGGLAQVTVYFEDATTTTRIVTLAANSRTTLFMEQAFPASAGRRFGTVVQSLPLPGAAVAPPIVVERAMYWNHQGVVWAAGTVALGTLLTP